MAIPVTAVAVGQARSCVAILVWARRVKAGGMSQIQEGPGPAWQDRHCLACEASQGRAVEVWPVDAWLVMTGLGSQRRTRPGEA